MIEKNQSVGLKAGTTRPAAQPLLTYWAIKALVYNVITLYTSFEGKLACVCVPILITTFPKWLSGTESLQHTPGAVRLSSLICSVLCAHAQFCRFDKADATADVQWHCNHWPPHWYHYFPAQSSLGADILVYWIGKIVRTYAPRLESNPQLPACKASTLSTRPGSPHSKLAN